MISRQYLPFNKNWMAFKSAQKKEILCLAALNMMADKWDSEEYISSCSSPEISCDLIKSNQITCFASLLKHCTLHHRTLPSGFTKGFSQQKSGFPVWEMNGEINGTYN